jgi:hypothetical protein
MPKEGPGLRPCPSDSKPSNQNSAIATRKGAKLGSILTNDDGDYPLGLQTEAGANPSQMGATPLPLSPIIQPPLWEHPPPRPQALTLPRIPPPMTTMDMLMDTITPAGSLLELRVSDAIQPKDPLFVFPITEAHGKSTIKSLMRPQDIARKLLPRDLFL